MCLHWADDHAAEDALARYRAATQGSLRARDFGAKVDALADACSDRLVDDLDRKITFIGGLNTADVVKIAAVTNGLSGFSYKKTTSSSPTPSSSAPKKTSANDFSPSSSSSARDAGSPTNWIDQAVSWQAKNPVTDKAKWFDSQASFPTKPIRCFNCGDIAGHYYRACPKQRKNPKVVVLAALASLTKLNRSSSSSPPDPTPPLDVETAKRFSELSSDDEGAGKVNEEGEPSVDDLWSFLSSRSPLPIVSSLSSLPTSPSCTSSSALLTASSSVGVRATLNPSPVTSERSELGTSSGSLKDASAKKKKKKNKSRTHAKSSPPAPEVAAAPLTVPALFGDEQVEGTALIDSGAQADVVSPALAHRLGGGVRRLVASVHADLAGDRQQVRLSWFLPSSVRVGDILRTRSFFVCPLPPGIDAILGVPWLKDTGTAIPSSRLFFAPDGPSMDVYDFDTGRFVDQAPRNLIDLGYTNRKITSNEVEDFLVCALQAGVSPSLLTDFVESIEFEPHNPLLDVDDNEVDDPNDLSKSDAKVALSELLAESNNVFVDELPAPPPYRPVNHDIPLVDEEKKIRPHAIRMPDQYAAQWSAHLCKFVETGFWSPAALDSACAMFAVPKHDESQARFVVGLKPRNDHTVKLASPIHDMKQSRYRVASHRRQRKLDFKGAYEQVRLNPFPFPSLAS
ncbi:hypothetical protein JCM11641_008387 [Rhodosporidiobolus odoratus]